MAGARKTREAQRYHYPGHLRTSTPKPAYCHRCKRSVISAHYDALPVIFDPQPLSLMGELDALLHGKKTWFVISGNLYKRNVNAIATSPTGRGGYIHQDHDCKRAQPTGAATAFLPPRPHQPGF